MIQKSKSYIVVHCTSDARPKFNRLQLRTEPLSFIELKPGKNILTLEDYPALKYGFSQISEDNPYSINDQRSTSYQDNCQDVISIDLSHFDASEMERMANMFEFMLNLEKINFQDIDSEQVKDASYAFYEFTEDLDLSDLDVSNLEQAECMLAMSVNNLTLDGWHIYADLENPFWDDLYPEHISMKGCDPKTVSWIIESLYHYIGEEVLQRITFDDDLCVEINSNGEVECYRKTIQSPSAKQFLKAFPDILIPETINQAFKGLFSFRGNPTPNLTNGFDFVNDIVNEIKSNVIESNRDGINIGATIFFPTDIDTDHLLKSVSICFVTSEDASKDIKVSNIFNEGRKQTIKIIDKLPQKDPYFKIRGITFDSLLGYYYPMTGSIIIFIDRILLGCNQPELELQKVILHEFIHAMLDISPRRIDYNEVIRLWNRHLLISDEEPIVNDLVESAYKNSSSSVTDPITQSQLIKLEDVLRSKLTNLEREQTSDFIDSIRPYSIRSGKMVPTSPEEEKNAIDNFKSGNDVELELYNDVETLKEIYQAKIIEYLKEKGWIVTELNYPTENIFGLYATKKVGELNLFQRFCIKMQEQEPAILTYCFIVNENLGLYFDSTDFIVESEHDEYGNPDVSIIKCEIKDKDNMPSLSEDFYEFFNEECLGLFPSETLQNAIETKIRSSISFKE